MRRISPLSGAFSPTSAALKVILRRLPPLSGTHSGHRGEVAEVGGSVLQIIPVHVGEGVEAGPTSRSGPSIRGDLRDP
jgi:hypothetical protein